MNSKNEDKINWLKKQRIMRYHRIKFPVYKFFQIKYGVDKEKIIADCIEKFIDLDMQSIEFSEKLRDCLINSEVFTTEEIMEVILGLGGHIHVGGG